MGRRGFRSSWVVLNNADSDKTSQSRGKVERERRRRSLVRLFTGLRENRKKQDG
jgi:hypothetical protein